MRRGFAAHCFEVICPSGVMYTASPGAMSRTNS